MIRNAGYNSNIAPGKSVSFDVCAENVNNIPSEQTVNFGECVNEPILPTRNGYIFVGWYLGERRIFRIQPYV